MTKGERRSTRVRSLSTALNTSPVARLSIDFRTVHLDDLVSQGGAVDLDSCAPELQWATISEVRTWRASPMRFLRHTWTALTPAQLPQVPRARGHKPI
jgi:hypothetical protein